MRILGGMLVGLLLWAPIEARAHGGGTDASGCHVDSSTGLRHCHTSGGSGSSGGGTTIDSGVFYGGGYLLAGGGALLTGIGFAVGEPSLFGWSMLGVGLSETFAIIGGAAEGFADPLHFGVLTGINAAVLVLDVVGLVLAAAGDAEPAPIERPPMPPRLTWEQAQPPPPPPATLGPTYHRICRSFEDGSLRDCESFVERCDGTRCEVIPSNATDAIVVPEPWAYWTVTPECSPTDPDQQPGCSERVEVCVDIAGHEPWCTTAVASEFWGGSDPAWARPIDRDSGLRLGNVPSPTGPDIEPPADPEADLPPPIFQ